MVAASIWFGGLTRAPHIVNRAVMEALPEPRAARLAYFINGVALLLREMGSGGCVGPNVPRYLHAVTRADDARKLTRAFASGVPEDHSDDASAYGASPVL